MSDAKLTPMMAQYFEVKRGFDAHRKDFTLRI